MIDEKERIKIIDFGTSYILNQSDRNIRFPGSPGAENEQIQHLSDTVNNKTFESGVIVV